jgi:4a-hydroxytetrahydrobiopterin dehydratase
MAKLSEAEVASRLVRAAEWTRLGDQIIRAWRFASPARALEFVNRVAALAEARGHYPEIVLQYRDVRIELATHCEGGLTEADFALAAEIDGLPTDR